MKRPILPFVPAFCVVALFCASLSSCMFVPDTDSGDDSTSIVGSATITADTPITALSFESNESSKTVTVTGLSGQSVFIVKQNNSSSAVATGTSGSLASEDTSESQNLPSIGSVSAVWESSTGKTFTRLDHAGARESLTKLPVSSSLSASRVLASRLSSTVTKDSDARSVGLAQNFWVECTNTSYDTDGDGWYAMPSTLRAKGTYCNVWVADDYYSTTASTSDGKMTDAQIAKIQSTFDYLYPYETAVFGYENGAEGDTSTGGVDGYTRINILLYDIDFDSATSGVVGYFWSKDNNAYTASNHSNVCEMFYIDSVFMDLAPGMTCSTLVHEFQHMIGYNQKSIKQSLSMDTWYTEMLSMVAEDMMSPYLEATLGDDYDVSTDGPIESRMPYYQSMYYLSGVTDFWSSPDSYVYASYGTAYAFGAYLARNYGGATLISQIAKNSSVDTASVSAALATLGKSETTFSAAFARYPEAMLFSSSNLSAANLASLNTFDRSVTATVGGNSYKFSAINIMTIKAYGTTSTYGVVPYNYTNDVIIRPYGNIILSKSSLYPTTSATVSFTVYAPTDKDVTIYVAVRSN